MVRIVFTLLVLGLVGLAPAQAEEFALKLRKIKVNKDSVDVLPAIELRAGEEVELAKEPKYRSKQVQKFVSRFGDGGGIVVAFAVDEKKGTGKGFDYLFVDLKGSGDLSKGKKLSGKCSPRGYSYVDTHFPGFEIQIPHDEGADGYPLQARFSCQRTSSSEASLYLMPLCVLEGDVKLGEQKLKMMVFDADCNGIFGEAGSPGGRVAQGDKIWIGKGSPKIEEAYIEALPIGKYYPHEGEYYELSFKGANGGKSVDVARTDVALGTIKLDNPGCLLELVAGDSVLYVSTGKDQTVGVPAGRYRLNTAGFRCKYKGKIWELEGQPGSCKESFSVDEGVETPVEVGPPLKIMVSTDLRMVGNGLVASMSFSIEGSSGERYQYLRMGGKKVDLPEIVIKGPGNKVVEEGQFEYG